MGRTTLVLAFATHKGMARDWKSRAFVWSTWLTSGSRIAHVAFGADEVMLEPLACGDRFYPLEPYLRHYPTLVCWVSVPIRPISLAAFAIHGRKRWWLSYARRLTLGRVSSDDCVQQAVRALRAGGVGVPPRTHTPAQLLRWLRAQGFPCSR